MKIDAFKDEYSFLSNFHPSPISIEGKSYPTVEHAFQAGKTRDFAEKEKIRCAATPAVAKRLGRKVKLRPDWENVKILVMLECLIEKFKDPELAKSLLNTGEAELIEGNTWNDTFWGVCRGNGKNNLGKLLMDVRTRLRNTAS